MLEIILDVNFASQKTCAPVILFYMYFFATGILFSIEGTLR